MVIDLQRKYRYVVVIDINSSGASYGGDSASFVVDEFTPPDVRSEPVTKHNQMLGQITLVGPKTYGEMTLRIALKIGETETMDLIDALEDLQLDDIDTCNVMLNTKSIVDAVEEVSYIQTFSNCRLTGYKLDPVSRKADDDFVHIEITLIPSHVSKVVKGTI